MIIIIIWNKMLYILHTKKNEMVETLWMIWEQAVDYSRRAFEFVTRTPAGVVEIAGDSNGRQ